MAGEAADRIGFLGRRYAIWIRSTALPAVAVVGVLAATPMARPATVAVLALVVAVSIIYLVGLKRHRWAWVTVIDAAALTMLGLSTRWTVPAEWLSTGKSWLVPLLTASCLAYQYYLRWRPGVVLAFVVHAGLAAGLVIAIPSGAPSFGFISACWSFVVTLLARALWTLVERGGARADAEMAQTAELQRRQRVNAEVRAAEQAWMNALHDTAATTLLMVGLGQGSEGGELLRRQAQEDLRIIHDREEALAEYLDLAQAIGAAIGELAGTVRLHCQTMGRLPAKVARTMAQATREAVMNAANHAKCQQITVSIGPGTHHGTGAKVVIADNGQGFDEALVPNSRRGVRQSIRGRMSDIGGSAEILSAAASGTTVTLRWADA